MIPQRGSGGFTAPREIEPAEGEPTGQLYHLTNDPSETKNLWLEHPEVVRRLSDLLETVKRGGQ